MIAQDLWQASWSNLVNNLSEEIYKIKYKCQNDDKKYVFFGIKYKYCKCFLQFRNFKDDLIEYRCLRSMNNYQSKFDEKLKTWFLNTYKFSNHDNNKFISLLRKSVFPYEYMDDWERFNKILLLEKEDFYIHLNMENKTDADTTHGKRVCKDCEIKKLGECHDLYVQSNILLSASVFENFQNIWLKIYELDSTCFLTAPRLAWQASLKKAKVKLHLSADIDMILMVEKDVRGGICHSTYQYGNVNNKYMIGYDKNKESSYLEYWEVNNLYYWAMSQKFP